jgi:DNA-binding response OmpR family regulator
MECDIGSTAMKESKTTILIVEDEEGIRLALEESLRYAGYAVLSAADGPQALKLGLEAKPDLILLDIMLPGLSGYEICRRIRDKGFQMPVIMLTARHEEFDKLHGFEIGADDYITKPFSMNEVMARIKAVLARGSRRASSVVYQFEEFTLDTQTRQLMRNGEEIPVTRTEFDLLAYFCANEGKALSRDVVMNDVWGMQYFGTQRSLDSFVASVRGKIEKDKSRPKHILTVHGVGYKFVK